MRITANINGRERTVDQVAPGESLLEMLRERLGLVGSKNGCEQGECGSCTVLVDGRPACACLVPAGQVDGCDVVTIEGLSSGNRLSRVQRCLLAAGGVQCGFCTPGVVVSLSHLLTENPTPSEPEVREALAGNVCRCTGYAKIVDAAQLAVAEIAGL